MLSSIGLMTLSWRTGVPNSKDISLTKDIPSNLSYYIPSVIINDRATVSYTIKNKKTVFILNKEGSSANMTTNQMSE